MGVGVIRLLHVPGMQWQASGARRPHQFCQVRTLASRCTFEAVETRAQHRSTTAHALPRLREPLAHYFRPVNSAVNATLCVSSF